METVEVVIKLKKERYDELQKNKHLPNRLDIEKAITDGTVLPKGHGALKDMNDLCYKSRYGCKGNCEYLHVCNSYGAPTIVEADKEEKA